LYLNTGLNFYMKQVCGYMYKTRKYSVFSKNPLTT
jgi:hypothetical protein